MIRSELAENGYAVGPQLDAQQLAKGRSFFSELVSGPWPVGFVSTARDGPAEERNRVSRVVRELVRPVLSASLGSVQIFLAAILNKSPGTGTLTLHQDLTYTNEPISRSYTCWIPLVDPEPSNGAIRVVDGSHCWTTGIRPAGPGAAQQASGIMAEIEARGTTPELRAGDLLIWDNALFHGSWANKSSLHRPALAATFTDPDAELRLHWAQSTTLLQAYKLDEHYLTDPHPFRAPPKSGIRLTPWGPPAAALEELPHKGACTVPHQRKS